MPSRGARLFPAGMLLLLLSLQVARSVPATAQFDAVVVTKRFGAALRLAPSSDATVFVTASCGETLSVVDARDGWYKVYSRASYLWVGGARVANASGPQPDCTGARTFQLGDEVVTFVPTGCLSLRYTPSRSAPFDSCVSNGHRYVIDNGPIEVNGEDWFEVWSPSTGSGWSLAEDFY